MEKHTYIKELFNNVRFLKINNDIEAITLSPSLLEEEVLFKEMFDFLTKKEFLQYNTSVILNHVPKNSFYEFGWKFPDWLNSKEFYPSYMFLIAFIDQILIVK